MQSDFVPTRVPTRVPIRVYSRVQWLSVSFKELAACHACVTVVVALKARLWMAYTIRSPILEDKSGSEINVRIIQMKFAIL